MSFSAALAAEAGRVDDTYFDSYSYLDIHREMLSDKVRGPYRSFERRYPAQLPNYISSVLQGGAR